MTDQPDPPADLDAGQVLPVDSLVPDVRDLPEGFWLRPVRLVQVVGGRL